METGRPRRSKLYVAGPACLCGRRLARLRHEPAGSSSRPRLRLARDSVGLPALRAGDALKNCADLQGVYRDATAMADVLAPDARSSSINARSRTASKACMASADTGSPGGRLRCSLKGFTNTPFLRSP